MTRLLTPEQAADTLGVTRKTIYEMSYLRQIDTVKLGGRLRIPADSVQQLIDRNRRKAIR